MKQKLYISIFFILYSISTFSKITVSIFEPIRFKKISTREIGADKIIGEGVIQISTDDKEKDYGKKIVFDFPKQALMSNRKKWIKVEKLHVEVPNKSLIVTQETEHVKVYAVLNKRDIDKGEEADIIEGRYEGYVPIIISQYGRLPNQPIPLPSYPDKEDRPTILPSFPDGPVVLPEV